MKNNIIKVINVTVGVFSILVLFLINSNAKAVTKGYALAMTPMSEKILLNPGDEYTSSLKIYTMTEYTIGVEYRIKASGYYVDDEYNNVFDECAEYCEMSDWITFKTPIEGKLAPGEEAMIEYTINVPDDAPGGGQYASILVEMSPLVENSEETGISDGDGEISSAIKEVKQIAYTIYAEVAGDIYRQGEVVGVDVPSFLLSGDIKGLTSIKNTGNVHGLAKYTLQVFPLFSSEEIYTNEEDPEIHMILPDRTYYHETVWDKTPEMGVFYVIYTVEFEGVTTQVNRVIVKCPVWLLFIAMTAITVLIIYIIMRVKARKMAKNNKNSAK